MSIHRNCMPAQRFNDESNDEIQRKSAWELAKRTIVMQSGTSMDIHVKGTRLYQAHKARLATNLCTR